MLSRRRAVLTVTILLGLCGIGFNIVLVVVLVYMANRPRATTVSLAPALGVGEAQERRSESPGVQYKVIESSTSVTR